MLYQSPLERKKIVKLKETQLSHLVIKLTKPFARLVRDEKLREVLASSLSRADNYAVGTVVDLVKLRAAIVLIVRVSWHFLEE